MKNLSETPQLNSCAVSGRSYDGVGMINQLTNATDRVWNARQFILPRANDIHNYEEPAPVKLKKENKMPTKRIVQVFIADPDTKMPLKDSLIYEGKSFLTDSDDEELFFDIPIKELLIKHNETREKTVAKKATDKSFVQYLEPTRIRELKMTVVTLAEF